MKKAWRRGNRSEDQNIAIKSDKFARMKSLRRTVWKMIKKIKEMKKMITVLNEQVTWYKVRSQMNPSGRS